MAITNIGYDGSVNETQWAKLVPQAGATQYGVAGIGDWKVTAHATLSLGVNVATGSGWGHGVYTSSDTVVALQGAAIASGTRWDMVVARRNWAGAGGTTTFTIVSGTSSMTLPSRNTNPGVLDDQPIALVQFTAGQTSATGIVDLRVWKGTGGGMFAADALARNYNSAPGTRLMVGNQDWVSTINGAGAQSWIQVSQQNAIQLFDTSSALIPSLTVPPDGTQFLVQSGTWVQTSDGAGYCRLTWPTPFPNGLLYASGFNGDDVSNPATFFSSSGLAQHGTSGVGDKSSWVYAVIAQDPVSKNFAKLGNKLHRINWLAIGY